MEEILSRVLKENRSWQGKEAGAGALSGDLTTSAEAWEAICVENTEEWV